MKIRFTDLGTRDNDSYIAEKLEDCKDETDKSCWKTMAGWPDEKCLCMGKTVAERIV